MKFSLRKMFLWKNPNVVKRAYRYLTKAREPIGWSSMYIHVRTVACAWYYLHFFTAIFRPINICYSQVAIWNQSKLDEDGCFDKQTIDPYRLHLYIDFAFAAPSIGLMLHIFIVWYVCKSRIKSKHEYVAKPHVI